MSGTDSSHTITSAPYALPLPVDAPGVAGVKRKLDPQEEAKLREIEYKKRLNQALVLDRMRALQPDYETPFVYQSDALQRLLCYHVYAPSPGVPTPDPKAEEDEWRKEFNSKALECSARLEKIKAQYEKHLQRPQSQPKEEKILLNKLSYFDEKFEVESLKTKLGIASKPAAVVAASPMARTASLPMTPASASRPPLASSPAPRIISTITSPSARFPSTPLSVSSAISTAAAAAAKPSAGTPTTLARTGSNVPSSHTASASVAALPSPVPLPLRTPSTAAPSAGAAAPSNVVAMVQTSSDGAPVIVLAPSPATR